MKKRRRKTLASLALSSWHPFGFSFERILKWCIYSTEYNFVLEIKRTFQLVYVRVWSSFQTLMRLDRVFFFIFILSYNYYFIMNSSKLIMVDYTSTTKPNARSLFLWRNRRSIGDFNGWKREKEEINELRFLSQDHKKFFFMCGWKFQKWNN